jgi:hypothetical protein
MLGIKALCEIYNLASLVGEATRNATTAQTPHHNHYLQLTAVRLFLWLKQAKGVVDNTALACLTEPFVAGTLSFNSALSVSIILAGLRWSGTA